MENFEKQVYQVELDPFPMYALPPNLRQLTEAVAENIQIAPDLFAVPLLATLCVPLQSRFLVRVDSGYTEPLCLYTIAIARPSERKSAVMTLLEKPLWEWQSKANENREEGQNYTTLYVTDATPERLARLMEENDGSISLMSDEPDALSVAAGLRYGKGKNLGLMLQAWSAGRVMIQRATDNTRIAINRATMSVAIMSQPSYIEDLVKDREMSTRGFLQRFLFAKPLSKVGARSFFKPEIPKTLLQEYSDLIKGFLDMDTAKIREIELSVDAKTFASIWFEEIEKRIEEDPVLEGWMGKLFGQTVRLAGILHCAMWGVEAAEHLIDDNTMQAAAALGHYFMTHAKAVFTDVNMSEEIADARELYRRMLGSDKEVFTKTDLYTLTRKNMKKARLEAALVQLLHGQYIMIVDENAEDRDRQYMLLGSKHELDESELC